MTAHVITAVCGHGRCETSASYLVWTSHFATSTHAVQCSPGMGLRCAKHVDELRAHWAGGVGGELLCGCVIHDLSDHFSATPL